jgi:hypothetical protein
MMKRWFVATTYSLVFFALSFYASAQDIATGGGSVLLVEAQATDRTVGGQLDSCEMTYMVAFEDHIYRRGAVSFLRGAVSFMGFTKAKDKPPAIILKVTAFDLENQNPKFAPLNYAFLTVAGQSYAKKEFVNFKCEDGGLCIGYEMLKFPELGDLFSDDFEINFNRAGGGSDVKVPISFVRDKPAEALKFSSCMVKLLDVVRQKFQE